MARYLGFRLNLCSFLVICFSLRQYQHRRCSGIRFLISFMTFLLSSHIAACTSRLMAHSASKLAQNMTRVCAWLIYTQNDRDLVRIPVSKRHAALRYVQCRTRQTAAALLYPSVRDTCSLQQHIHIFIVVLLMRFIPCFSFHSSLPE